MIEDALLWAVYDPKKSTTHYLFGTMHLQPEYALELVQAVQPYLEECDLLACETDIGELTRRSGEIGEMTRSPIPMSSCYTEHHFRRMKKYLHRFTGLDLQALDHLRPLFAQQMISEYMLNLERKVSLDQLLWEAAGQRDMIQGGLESVDAQLAYIEEIDLQQQCSIFRNWMSQLSKHREYLHRVIEWYRRQNIRQLYHISSGSLGAIRKLLLYKRNKRMVSAFSDDARTNAVFAAVGAAHLYGYKGMLRMLKHRGYNPRAVSTAWSIQP